jgi:N-acetylneuraminic acid mutarotase
MWLFGGYGRDADSTASYLNDLWRFDGTNWTWISGSPTGGQAGAYGTKGVPSASNVPGARFYAVSWIDATGDLWLFGGNGRDSTGTWGGLNDLWRFDGTNWTWISGNGTGTQPGIYGTMGTPSASNVPGSRQGATSWYDASGDFWLFGGFGYQGALNDLWRFDGANWTWMSGSSTAAQPGSYGTKGVPSGANVPGARQGPVSWIDGSGDLWLFGGNGWDSGGIPGLLNDLWRFDGANWTWITGSSIVDQSGNYGIQGTPSAANTPGAREFSISWFDSNGDFWLHGGRYPLGSNYTDLWRFQP